MAWNNDIPEWENEGVQPPDDLIENGFQVRQKPPAAFFNWFWNRVTKAIKELQTAVTGKLETDLSNITAIPVNKGGTGATTTGKARENLSVNLMTFIGFNQINITVGEETIDGIVDAMPSLSELVCDIGSSNAKIYPNSYGVLRVIKTNTTRTMFYFYLKGNNAYYFGNYDSSLSEPWQGWATVYNSANLPTPAYNHKTHELISEDLNTCKEPGYYVAAGSNTCTNTPLPVGTSFGLEVSRSAGTHYTQVIHSTNNGMYVRYFDGSSWQEWYRFYSKHNLPYAGQVQFGTYTGTGKSGAANRCRLDFGFQPKYVLIQRYYADYDYRLELMYGVTSAVSHRTGGSSSYFMYENTVTWGSNYVEWYTDEKAGATELYQLNGAITYRYIAIG